jgi:hypothetical protein
LGNDGEGWLAMVDQLGAVSGILENQGDEEGSGKGEPSSLL